MGFLSKAKDFVKGEEAGDSEADEMAEDWVDEIDSEVEESEEMMEEDEEVEQNTEVREWDSAYKFAEEYLEVYGFTSMMDFTNKCMAHKINKSPMYRDRLRNGVNTMNQITSMQEQIQEIKGGEGSDRSYDEYATMLSNANQVIDEAQKLSGEEDAMVRDVIGLGQDLVSVMGQQAGGGRTGRNVQSSVESVDDEM